MDRVRPIERNARGLYTSRACLYELDQRVLDTNMRQDVSVPSMNRGPARSSV